VLVAGQQEAQEADDRGHNGASSSQEHVRTIAALQRMQASQANFRNDPALDISRPKLRDNRQVSIPACAFSQSQMLPRPSLLHHEAVPSSFVTQCCSGLLSQHDCVCHKPDVSITVIPSHVPWWVGVLHLQCVKQSLCVPRKPEHNCSPLPTHLVTVV